MVSRILPVADTPEERAEYRPDDALRVETRVHLLPGQQGTEPLPTAAVELLGGLLAAPTPTPEQFLGGCAIRHEVPPVVSEFWSPWGMTLILAGSAPGCQRQNGLPQKSPLTDCPADMVLWS